MSYEINFEGVFTIEPQLSMDHYAYLRVFGLQRHVKRNVNLISGQADPIREQVGLPLGVDGEYFVAGMGQHGSANTPDVIDHNNPPSTQPSLYCGWMPSTNGRFLEWDHSEGFVDFEPWLQYLITYFFHHWGYTINGQVMWDGHEVGDTGMITVVDNEITTEKLVWPSKRT